MHLPACLLLAGLLASALMAMPHTAVRAQTCPPGWSPASTARFGELFLPNGAIPYSIIGVYRFTLAPGEELATKPDVPVMYIVESGELHYPRQSWTGVNLGPTCTPDPESLPATDEYTVSSGGSISITADDQEVVTAGQTLIAEHGLVGPLQNGGTEPLVLVQIIVRTPKIDPESGLPIVDAVTAHRERDRDFQLRRQECRARLRAIAAGTPVANLTVPLATPEPTPAFTTADENSDKRMRHRIPRACEQS